MAQYKVLQDIEAEDKLLGPLSLRQFIYAIVVIAIGFTAFQLAKVQWLLAVPFLPPLVFFALLAAPFGREQSSEVWLLAKIKFFIFPRKRIWNQSGIQKLVTITAPVVEEKHLTKDFDKDVAKSRLKALANTMDTRGWAIKNISTAGYRSPAQQTSSDRLLELETIPQDDLLSVKPSEDVLDSNTTPLAQQMNSMVAQNQQAHRQAILQKMQTLAHQQQAQQPTPVAKATPAAPQVAAAPKPAVLPQQPMTQAQAPDIINPVTPKLSLSELQVRAKNDDNNSSDEVVVSLH